MADTQNYSSDRLQNNRHFTLRIVPVWVSLLASKCTEDPQGLFGCTFGPNGGPQVFGEKAKEDNLMCHLRDVHGLTQEKIAEVLAAANEPEGA